MLSILKLKKCIEIVNIREKNEQSRDNKEGGIAYDNFKTECNNGIRKITGR